MTYFLFTIAVLGFSLAYCLCTPFYLISRIYPPAKAIADIIMQKGIYLLMRIQPWLKMNIQVPQNPRGQLLIANHRSHLDVFLFLAHVQGVRVVAKDSLFRVPFLGFIMRMSYQIPVVRGSMSSYYESLATVEKYLQNGEVVLFFPEMTRSSSGLQDFALPPFRFALNVGAEIVPVVVQGSEKIWPKSKMSLVSGQTVSLRALPAIKSAKYTSAEALCAEVRSQMLQELH